MTCLKCGNPLKQGRAKLEGEYAGERFTVQTEALVCDVCGYKTVHATKLDEYRTQLADAYRRKHQLLTSHEIREIRNRLRMSQQEFANYIGAGIASVKRWELGQAQDPSMDQLIRLRCNEKIAEENLRDILLRHGGDPDEYSGYEPFGLFKLANAILFFLRQAASEHKTVGPLHLNKLLWYADVEHFRVHKKSITGARYARLPYGPVLDDYTLIFRELELQSYIQSKGLKLHARQAIDYTFFSSSEIHTLKNVWKRFHNRLSRIVDMSHAEPAWKNTPHAQLVSFKKAV